MGTINKPKQKKSAGDAFIEWAKKEGIEVRTVKGSGKVTAVFKPKPKKKKK